jgi:hypothetical protein
VFKCNPLAVGLVHAIPNMRRRLSPTLFGKGIAGWLINSFGSCV